MSDANNELAKVMARRKLEEGEFSYVLKLGGEPLSGKKAAYTKLKEIQPEVFAKIKTSCQTAGETDEAFDNRMLKMLPQLPFEDEPKDGEAMEVEEDHVHDELTADYLFRVVRVDGMKKVDKDEAESYFSKEYEGVEKVKKATWIKKGGKNRGPQNNGVDVYFKDEKLAEAFLEKEFKYKEQTIKTLLLKDLIQEKIMRRQFAMTFSHHLRILSCIPLEKGKEDSYILVYGIGKPTHEELEEYFLGLESEFENVVAVKTVIQTRGENDSGVQVGILVQFEDNASLVKFTQLKDVKYKEKVLKYNAVNDTIRNNEIRTKKVNYMVDDGPTTQQLSDRRVMLLRLKDDFSSEVEKQLKSQFPEAKDVRHCSIDKLTVITFPTAESAKKAVRNLGNGDVIKPVNVMLLSEYLEIRQKIIEEEAVRIEKTKTKYENLKNSSVTVDGNIIKICGPALPKQSEKKVKKDDEKKEAQTKKKEIAAEVVAKAQPIAGIMRKRMNRGPNAFDNFVGVRGFNQHIRNMGKASDMDICNYFIHNHKDVADVKFVNWTDIVFAKFKSVEAAEKFISLSYHMFYGVDLHLHDVPEFLKKKSDQQKEDVSKVLIGKKFNKSMIEGGNAAVTNGTGGAIAKVGVPKTPEVVLADFSSKQAGESIRELFIENLHLDQEVVSQTKWMKGAGDVFKAKLTIKLEENAIGYLVKKWNDLEISVEGETVVKAELSGSTPVVAATNGAAKRGRKRPNNAGNKRARISLEDY